MVKKPKYYFQCPFCKKRAFLMYKKPISHETLKASNCVFHDGTKPISGDNVKCFQCKVGIPDFYLKTERILKL